MKKWDKLNKELNDSLDNMSKKDWVKFSNRKNMIQLNESEYKITETYLKEGVKQIVIVHLYIKFTENNFDVLTSTHADNFSFNDIENNCSIDRALAINKGIKKAIKIGTKLLRKYEKQGNKR